MSLESKLDLKDQVYNIIKDEINKGNIKANQHLLATELSKKYNVSRTPVREAFSMLEKEGYLKGIPKKGYRVMMLSHNDLLEIFMIRLLLEKGAAFLAADKIKTADIDKLFTYCDYRGADDKQIYDYNKKFHLTIARASGNSRLYKIIDRSIDDVSRILALDPYMQVESYSGSSQHLKIIEALQQRNAQLAGEMMEKHLLQTRKRIHEAMLE